MLYTLINTPKDVLSIIDLKKEILKNSKNDWMHIVMEDSSSSSLYIHRNTFGKRLFKNV
jgi:hypothetical protein